MHPWLDQLVRALDEEAARQRRELDDLRRLPLAEQVAVGVAWSPLHTGDVVPLRPGRALWTVRGALHDGIGAGDLVEVTALGASSGLRGRVWGVDEGVAEVAVDGDDEAPVPERVSVHRRFDASTFERFRGALLAADRKPGPVGRALLAEAPPAATPLPSVPPGFEALNPAQQAAVADVLGRDAVALVHGPPGTGKTHLLATLLRELVARGERPWALADSNAATDHLALSAAREGLRVVRLGHTARMSGEAAALSLDAQVRDHPTASALRPIDRDLARLRGQQGAEARRERAALQAERFRLREAARDAVISRAQVIAATFGTLARWTDKLPPTRTAVVDEATQATEPAVWVAVPHVERLVLVGDPHQLGPVVTTPGSLLADSLLQRLVAKGAPAPMLTEQHRMSAGIAELVRDVYGPAYHPAPAVAEHRLAHLPGVAEVPETTTPVTWIDTAGWREGEQVDPTTRSLFHPGEVDLVAQVVQAWRDAGVPDEAIGVLAPYSAQVLRLRQRLPGLDVATINAFQGREREAVVVSFVRSNADGELGFLADRRRLVVALTRARRALVLVGDSATLAGDPWFAEVLRKVDAAGGLESAWARLEG